MPFTIAHIRTWNSSVWSRTVGTWNRATNKTTSISRRPEKGWEKTTLWTRRPFLGIFIKYHSRLHPTLMTYYSRALFVIEVTSPKTFPHSSIFWVVNSCMKWYSNLGHPKRVWDARLDKVAHWSIVLPYSAYDITRKAVFKLDLWEII